jgi:hypothetical protein
MSDPSCARQRARSSTFIVSESLFPIRSHREYYLKVPPRVFVESTCTTSRVSPTHYPRWHPCKSQPAKSKSQRRLIRKAAGDRPLHGTPRRAWNAGDGQVRYKPTFSVFVPYSWFVVKRKYNLHFQTSLTLNIDKHPRSKPIHSVSVWT